MSCVSCVSCEGPPARAFSGAFVFQTQLFSLLRLARSRVPGYSSPRPGSLDGLSRRIRTSDIVTARPSIVS